MIHKSKYLKYKQKYIELKNNQVGGNIINPRPTEYNSTINLADYNPRPTEYESTVNVAEIRSSPSIYSI
jgi:hypothetical protein